MVREATQSGGVKYTPLIDLDADEVVETRHASSQTVVGLINGYRLFNISRDSAPLYIHRHDASCFVKVLKAMKGSTNKD